MKKPRQATITVADSSGFRVGQQVLITNEPAPRWSLGPWSVWLNIIHVMPPRLVGWRAWAKRRLTTWPVRFRIGRKPQNVMYTITGITATSMEVYND